MESCWWVVLLLSAVTLHVCLSQAPVPNTSEEEELIQEALQLYNQREDPGFLFRLLTPLPTNLLQEDGDSPDAAFMMKETECLQSEERPLESCAYSKDGDVMICAVYPEEEKPSDALRCANLSQVSGKLSLFSRAANYESDESDEEETQWKPRSKRGVRTFLRKVKNKVGAAYNALCD